MTVHWVNVASLKREKAVLGIKEIAVQQTGTYLAKAMMDLHREFGITNKVVSTTTDNGANYVSAFKLFAGNVETMPEIDSDEVGKFCVIMSPSSGLRRFCGGSESILLKLFAEYTGNF